jgi:hypothetical protein
MFMAEENNIPPVVPPKEGPQEPKADAKLKAKADAEIKARVEKATKLINKGRKAADESGDVNYDADERVKVAIEYPSDWKGKKHLKDGTTYTVHPLTALNYVRNGFGDVTDVVVGKKEAAK